MTDVSKRIEPLKHELRGHRVSEGFTLIEVLFALAILSFVLLTTILVLLVRKDGTVSATEQLRVWQVIENEAEIRRFTPWHLLPDGAELPFESDLEIIDGLDATTVIRVEEKLPNLKVLTLEVVWGERRASLDVYRAETGRGPLW